MAGRQATLRESRSRLVEKRYDFSPRLLLVIHDTQSFSLSRSRLIISRSDFAPRQVRENLTQRRAAQCCSGKNKAGYITAAEIHCLRGVCSDVARIHQTTSSDVRRIDDFSCMCCVVYAEISWVNTGEKNVILATGLDARRVRGKDMIQRAYEKPAIDGPDYPLDLCSRDARVNNLSDARANN